MSQADDLTLIKLLGKGSFGEVYLSKIKGKNQYFATKRIERKNAESSGFKKYIENEIDLIRHLNHPNILKLEGVKISQNHYYIIMEYINGGELSACLKKYMERYKKAFPEEIVQYLMKQIVSGIKHFHDKNIIHRDLKLENIMLNFDNQNDIDNYNIMKAKVKIIDFGFSIMLNDGELAKTAIGTFPNMAPQILIFYAFYQNRWGWTIVFKIYFKYIIN